MMKLKGIWLWIIISILIILAIQVQGCWEAEREALLYLKPLFYPDRVASWKEHKRSNCCDGWSGVKCGTNGRVQSLLLSGYNMVYTGWHFNASVLLPFEELKELDISSNEIVSWTEAKGLTKLLSRLKSLQVLDISSNMLNNSALPYISGFPSLKHLYLGANYFNEPVLVNDSSTFYNLKKLDFSQNGISSFIISQGLSKLEELDLSGNELDNSILSNLSGLPSLRHLRLQGNLLSGQIQLHDVQGIMNLEELNLEGNSIEDIMTCDGCDQIQRLRTLDLGYNKLGTVPFCLGSLPYLQELRLHYNQFSGDIPSCLQNLKDLQTLDLSHNQFSGRIPSWLGGWKTLRVLNLTNNQFSGNIALSPLINLFSLEVLALSHNQFQIPHSFKAFANHSKLKCFLGDSNKVIMDDSDVRPVVPGFQFQVLTLSDCALITLPPFLQHQYDLRIIDLSHNRLQGNFPSWLLESNRKLDSLVLEYNSFTGQLQLPSFPHAYITHINVKQNKLQGRIPDNMGAIFLQLTGLVMSYNNFDGKIPLNFCDMKSLRGLDLSNNHLSGLLVQVTRCTNLLVLSLSNNNFEGEIPSFYRLPSLQFLDLRGNRLSGPLTANLFPENLEVLSLSRNFLQGLIPDGFCRLEGLDILDLSHNKLNGCIPPCLNSTFITHLYLSNNRLGGHFMDALCNTRSLVTLDLSNNELSGEIPTCLSDLRKLNVLLLRGNQLQGQIPVEFCQLLGLSILDLSYNNISGHIPPCLGMLNFFPQGRSGTGYGIAWSKAGLDIEQLVPLDDLDISIGPSFETDWAVFTTKGMTYRYEGDIVTYMSGIDLSCNRFSGEIPRELGNLSSLHAMNLSHNELGGAIPTTFSNLTHLESLDLSYNSLSGSISSQLTELNSLEVFKVAYNNLSGEIPFAAHFVTFDASSYAGNPFLCGSPLSEKCAAGNVPFRNPGQKVVDDEGWMDMKIFRFSFAASFLTMFLGVLVILRINTRWEKIWFHLAKTCMLSIYDHVEEAATRIRRAH